MDDEISYPSENEPDPPDSDIGEGRFIGRKTVGSKLPAFTGLENWNVWFNRFSDVARMNRWTTMDRLNELLPRLQGIAGDFVYGQLPQSSRTNYRRLIHELGYRFLDGLQDDAVRFHVEYVKEPTDIDEAVYGVVHFLETNRHSRNSDTRRPTRAATFQEYQEEDKQTLSRGDRRPPTRNESEVKNRHTDKKNTSNEGSTMSKIKELENSIDQLKNLFTESIGKLEKKENIQRSGGGFQQGPNDKSLNTFTGGYRCGGSHYARNCTRYSGEMRADHRVDTILGDVMDSTHRQIILSGLKERTDNNFPH